MAAVEEKEESESDYESSSSSCYPTEWHRRKGTNYKFYFVDCNFGELTPLKDTKAMTKIEELIVAFGGSKRKRKKMKRKQNYCGSSEEHYNWWEYMESQMLLDNIMRICRLDNGNEQGVLEKEGYPAQGWLSKIDGIQCDLYDSDEKHEGLR